MSYAKRLKASLLAAAGVVCCAIPVWSQPKITKGPEMSPALRFDVSPELSSLPHTEHPHVAEPEPRMLLPRVKPPAGPRQADPVLQSTQAPLNAPGTLTNFDGISNGLAGFTVSAAPPDPNLAVGPNHLVQMVNTDVAVYSKAGTLLYGPLAVNTLWQNFGGLCQADDDGDVVVRYDAIADRFVITQFAVKTPQFLECVAVSQTPDPTGAYYRYAFSYAGFNDYPKIGVWPDAYYMTYNLFTSDGKTFLGAKACALDRSKMLLGQAATQQCFNTSTSFGGLLPSDFGGTRLPPAGAANHVLALGAVDGQLAFWNFHVDWTTPGNSTWTGPTVLTTAAFALPCSDTGGVCVSQLGTAQKLDTLGDRLMFRLAYRNFGDHEALVTNHTVDVGGSTGVRWYELRLDSSGNPSLFQQGTYAPDSNARWLGSIAMDQAGNMGLGYSVSSAALHPQIRYTGRLVTDAVNTMGQGEGTLFAGNGSQTGQNLYRWGDYSSMDVDPSDGCTFWYTSEYIPSDGAFNWRTRIASFKFPNCGGTPPSTAAASFLKTDTTTLGNWKGAYGVDGYAIANDVTSYPAYAQVSLRNQIPYTWATSTSDVRGLQNATGRIASTWYSSTSVDIDINLTDGKTHQVSLYGVDWDIGAARTERVDVLDATTNAVLDSRTTSRLDNGDYLVWNLTGHVLLRVTIPSGGNAVVSGIFFGSAGSAPPPPPPTSSATFLKTDATTQGNWRGAYGVDGYAIANDATSYPAYVQVSLRNQTPYLWAASTSDVRGLQTATGRIAATWYSPTSVDIDINLTDGKTHQVSVYGLDWDIGAARTERIDVLDANTNAVLDSRTTSRLDNGDYLVWNLTGHVILRVMIPGGGNAVVSGIFFGSAGSAPPPPPPPPSSSATFVKADPTTKGNWKGAYGADGYAIANDATSYPAYAQVSLRNQIPYTWATSTSDVRGLQNATGRIASTWYSPTSVDIDINLTDGKTHQVSLYGVDWDIGAARTERVDVLDATTNAVLDSRTTSRLDNSDYLVWNLTGHVLLRVTIPGGGNAVVSGIFLN